jgi:glycerophosphoryl diester phosphodiesterase
MRRRPLSPVTSSIQNESLTLLSALSESSGSDSTRRPQRQPKFVVLGGLGLGFFVLGMLLWVLGIANTRPVFLCALKGRPPFHSQSDVVLVAHRGSESPFPENSLPAAVHGAEVAGFVEIDLALTRDGNIVLMHDSTVDRTTNGSGTVCEFSTSEIAKLRLRDPAKTEAPRTKCRETNSSATGSASCMYFVPTLEHVFTTLPTDTKYMLDLKVCYTPGVPQSDPEPVRCNDCVRLRHYVKRLLSRYNIKVKSVVFTSTDIQTLRSFAEEFPSASFAFSIDLSFWGYSVDDFMALLERDDWDAVCMYYGMAGLRTDLVSAIKSSKSNRTGGMREVYAWTIRRPYQARIALCSGITNLIVADPAQMSSYTAAASLASISPNDRPSATSV